MDIETVVYIVLEVVIGFVVVIGNTLVCYVVLHSTVLRKKVMYMFVTSLALADICVGAIAIPFAILTKLGVPHGSPRVCMAMLSFIMIPTQISIFNLMAISIERYLAIRHPRVHYTKLTTNRSLTVIVLTWVISVVIGMLPLLGWNKITSAHYSSHTTSEISSRTDDVDKYTTETLQNNSATDIRTLMTTASSRDQIQTENDVTLCQFMEVMDGDYMFFDFTACVLPPLLTSAVLYFVIFLSLMKPQPPIATPASTPTTNGNKLSHHENGANMCNDACLEQKSNKDIIKKQIEPFHLIELNGKPDPTKHNGIQFKNGGSAMGNSKDVIILQAEPPSSPDHVTSYPVIPLLHNNASVHVVDSPIRETSGLDKTVLIDRLNNLALHGKPTQDRFSMFNGLHSAINSLGSSMPSTPALMRSRTGTDLSITTKKRHQEARHQKRRREIHAAAVLGLIVLSFTICWMPIHILNSIKRFDYERTMFVPAWLYSVAILLSHANSAVNFFLYSWRLRVFQKHLHKTVIDKLVACCKWD